MNWPHLLFREAITAMGGILKGLFGSLVGTPTSRAGPQQPLSIEQVVDDEAKPIHDVSLSGRPGTDPHQSQNKPDSAGLLGSLVGAPTSGVEPQQPLSIEQVVDDEVKPIHDVDLSDRPGTDPHQSQNKPDSASLLGSLVATPTRGAGPQQPLSIEQMVHDEAKPIDDADLSARSGTDPHRAQNNLDSAGWQPILTAPINRDLEVRVADPMGHYALMCPCKLMPEYGWINSWLQTPLSHDPVEWREWAEPLAKY
jgi:hypothetical protein